MFPISDVIPSRRRPVVTMGLIAANTLVFLYQLWLDEAALQQVLSSFALIPVDPGPRDLVTSMFLHADLLHFGANMVFLWIFGDNVEDRMGHAKFAAFYLIAGMIASFAQVAADPSSLNPLIGASGAIAAVMGAYFLLYPQSRILTAIFLVIFMDVVEVPAIFFLGVWFLLQVLQGSMGPGGAGETAFWAHAGGFMAGVIAGLWIRRRDRTLRAYWQRS